jgi:hypothetical protein
MSIANHFYNGTTRKYIAIFGSIFNKISITRDDNDGFETQRMVVPISYGPYQKFLARISQDPNLDQKSAITLPRMSFEILSMSYDGSRKIGSTNKLLPALPNSDPGSRNLIYTPAPYNIEFNLYIMTKHAEDGTKILEQIIPFFKPEYTTSAKLMNGLDPFDIPLVLNNVSIEDIYEVDFETRRSLMWTLSFTMKCYFFGPTRSKKIIKFVDSRIHGDMDSSKDPLRVVNVQPGLTANGQPTTDIDSTIPYEEIEIDDDWGIITIIRDYDNELD